MNITKLPSRLSGNAIDKQVQMFLIELRSVGEADCIARGSLGGEIVECWWTCCVYNGLAHYLHVCMGYVNRKGNTKAKMSIETFEELRINFLYSIKGIVTMEEILSSLIINWDHAGLKYVLGPW